MSRAVPDPLADPADPADPGDPGDPVDPVRVVAPLAVRDLRITLGGREILAGVDLEARAGRVTVVLGPNGAGKTTLIRCCTGLLPDDGAVRIAGLAPVRAVADGRLGVMPQSQGAWSQIRAGELLTQLARMHVDPLDPGALARRLRIDDAWRTPYRRLSGGQQQAVNLIAAVVGRPEVVFLDEPTAGMDPRARRTTWSLIDELAGAGVAVVLTTHAMTEAAELGDEVSIMDRGRIRIRGTVAELTADGSDLETVFLRETEQPGRSEEGVR